MVVDQRPVVTAVADERVGLSRARHPEVGFDPAHKGGHAGEGPLGIPEDRHAVVPLPRRIHGL